MTDPAVRALIERMKSDEAFRERVLAVAGADARLELVRAEGFDVTAEHLAAEAAMLTDEDLLQAVGAGSPACELICDRDDTCGY